MANLIQFGNRQARCMECEENLTDALDGALNAAEQARFDEHIASCAACSQRLSEAQRGAAWLEMLRTPRPEPSAALLERIIAQTSGQAISSEAPVRLVEEQWPAYPVPVFHPGLVQSQPSQGQAFVGPPLIPSAPSAKVLSFPARIAASSKFQTLRYHLLQPRLAMTAAMAFFSVALTLNLTGVRLDQLHASDLGPTGIRRAFFDTSARAARYYSNLRVVYVMESRLDDLRRNSEDDVNAPPPTGGESSEPERKQAPGPGTSKRDRPQAAGTAPQLLRVSDVGFGAGLTDSVASSGGDAVKVAIASPAAKPESVRAEGE
jgi:hypothetical protein